MMIDYTKLNNRIVEQAHEASRVYFSLSEEQKQRLFQNKIDRAVVQLKAQEQFKRLAQEN